MLVGSPSYFSNLTTTAWFLLICLKLWLLLFSKRIHDKSDPSNYRPIFLSCICCKIMEHIVLSHTAKHLSTNWRSLQISNMTSGNDIPVKPYWLISYDDWAKSINMRRQTNALLLNFSKAFDSVPHQRLLIKLNSWLWCLGWYAYVDLRFFLKSLSSSLHIQLFREKLSGKVHATILKGIVGGFEFFFFKKIWKNWHERPWKCVYEC